MTTEPTDATPLNVIDLMRVVMDADNETRGFALRGTTNWAAHIGKAVQNAVIAKLWTPEQIAEAKERAKKFDHWLATTPQPTHAVPPAKARLIHWQGPKHLPVPHSGIGARTFDEFYKESAEKPDAYWRNGEDLYTLSDLGITKPKEPNQNT